MENTNAREMTAEEREKSERDDAAMLAAAKAAAAKARRERIATAVLAGICANSEAGSPTNKSGPRDAEIALHYADALIAELDK